MTRSLVVVAVMVVVADESSHEERGLDGRRRVPGQGY